MKTIASTLLCISLLGIVGCGRHEPAAQAATTKAAEAVPVQTVAAQSRLLERSLSVTGSLNPDETVSVSSEVPGRVLNVYTDFGQNVRKGQIIAELDKQELNLAVERSKASLAQALARLGLDPEQENERPQNTPGVLQAQAQLEDARSKYENASRLVKTGDISQERFTEIQKQFQAREALYQAARDETRTLLAQVQALKTEVSLARKRLNDASVRAPFDGSVSEKLISAGQYIKENTPIVTLVKTTPLRLRMELPEAAAGSVQVGTALAFTTGAAPGTEFQAVVREVNPSVDAKSRTLTAEARLTSNDPRLRPGMFVQVQLRLSKGIEGVVVPKRAIYTIAGLTKIFVVQNGKAVERRVSPGQDLGDWIEVPADSVRAGENVAVSSLDQLVTGTPVRSVPKG